MPNHVHIIVVPSDADGLRRTFADAHRRYTGYINARHRWTGHLWQGRFGAVVMDDERVAMSPGHGCGSRGDPHPIIFWRTPCATFHSTRIRITVPLY